MSAIRLDGVSKHYRLYHSPLERLREIVTGRPRHHDVHALHPIDLDIPHGEVVGVVGNNGAGKSTLLKLVTGTLAPSTGGVAVNGRISALLELGAGFHPEVSGRENVYLSGALAGISRGRMDELYPGIVEFSGIGEFIDQPVKTYSSGMFVRLAFAVATAVEPDILIIDEALAVGDGAFARKSFDRIMSFREAGKTILFCSHSLYQVEAICGRVIWLEKGAVRMDGEPQQVIAAYGRALAGFDEAPKSVESAAGGEAASPEGEASNVADASAAPVSLDGGGRISAVTASADGVEGRELALISGESRLAIEIAYEVDPELPDPTLGVAFVAGEGGAVVTSSISRNDGAVLARGADGSGRIRVVFDECALLKGRYTVDLYLACEQGVHFYDWVSAAVTLDVTQKGLEVGYVMMAPRRWEGC